MNEVQVEGMIQRYRDNGELDSEDPAMIMLKQWPLSERFKNEPDKLASLEKLVCQSHGFADQSC